MSLVKILLPDPDVSLMHFSVKGACMYVCVHFYFLIGEVKYLAICYARDYHFSGCLVKKKKKSIDEEHFEQDFQLSLFSLNILNTINASSGNYYNIFRAEK